MTIYTPKERALRKLVKAAEAIVRGMDRNEVAEKAAKFPGSVGKCWASNAKMRDLIDAAEFARKAIEEEL